MFEIIWTTLRNGFDSLLQLYYYNRVQRKLRLNRSFDFILVTQFFGSHCLPLIPF